MRISRQIKLGRYFIRFMHVLAFVALMTMMITVVANIIGRIFFKTPIMGTLEIAGFAGVIVVAVAIGFAQRENRNVVVDIVAQRFSSRIRRITDSVTFLLSLTAIGFLFWAVAESAIESLASGDVTLTLGIQTFPFRFIWAIGLLVLCGFLIKHIVTTLRGDPKK